MPDESDVKTPAKRKMGRSPGYPNFSVQKAIEKAKALYDREGDYASPLPAATAAWGYSSKSSAARQALATLRYYGLIDISGDGDARKIKISDIARRIILDRRDDDSEKRDYIKKVALKPAAHKAIYENYKLGLGSDNSITHFLVFDHGYNQSAAAELLAEFKETARFAGLYEPSTEVDKSDSESQDRRKEKLAPEVKVGDHIQWTSQGVDQFARGAKVLGFSDDGQWVFTDQGSSGVRLSEVSVVETTADVPPQMPSHLAAIIASRQVNDTEESKPGSRRAVFPVEGGDVTLIFPEHISAEGLEDLDQYLQIFLKKERRKRSIE